MFLAAMVHQWGAVATIPQTFKACAAFMRGGRAAGMVMTGAALTGGRLRMCGACGDGLTGKPALLMFAQEAAPKLSQKYKGGKNED